MLKKLQRINCRSLLNNIEALSRASSTTVDTTEIQHFKQLNTEWWDPMGYLKPLHSLNQLRVPLIRDGLLSTTSTVVDSPQPLRDLSILDVGCGGGILTEPLARIGANVTGLDASPDLIEKAKLHAKLENLPGINYVFSSVEEYANENANKYDAVVASEIVEHVTQKEQFLAACLKCLKPGGSVFITTISKTCYADFMGIFLAENVFNFLPRGTHEFDKFIEPHRLQRLLEDLNAKTILVHGMFYNPFTNQWTWCSNSDINYALHAIKLEDVKL